MTPSEAYDAAAGHTAAAFAITDPAVAAWHWYGPDDHNAVAAPGVWIELQRGERGSVRGLDRTSVRIQVAVEQLETGPTTRQWLDAADRLIAAWRTGPASITVVSASYQLTEIDLGGVPHNGLAFDVVLEHAASAC